MKTASIILAVAALGALSPSALGLRKQAPSAISWGMPRDGLQVGLEIIGARPRFRYGEVFSLRLHLKNVGDGPVELALKSPQSWSAVLNSDKLVTMNTNAGEPTLIRVERDQTIVPNSNPAEFMIIPPGGAMVKGQTALPLEGGVYRLRVPTPLWIQDKEDKNRATGIRANPGEVSLVVDGVTLRNLHGPTRKFRRAKQVRDDSQIGTTEIKLEEPGKIEPAWGAPVNGLQAGIRLREPGQPIKEGEKVRLEILLRNITTQPLSVSYPVFAAYDYVPGVTDSRGERVNVESTFVSGLRVKTDETIAPGEAVVVGYPEFIIGKGRQEGKWVPVVDAAPGKHTVQYFLHPNPGGAEGLTLLLKTGILEFEVN